MWNVIDLPVVDEEESHPSPKEASVIDHKAQSDTTGKIRETYFLQL